MEKNTFLLNFSPLPRSQRSVNCNPRAGAAAAVAAGTTVQMWKGALDLIPKFTAQLEAIMLGPAMLVVALLFATDTCVGAEAVETDTFDTDWDGWTVATAGWRR